MRPLIITSQDYIWYGFLYVNVWLFDILGFAFLLLGSIFGGASGIDDEIFSLFHPTSFYSSNSFSSHDKLNITFIRKL